MTLNIDKRKEAPMRKLVLLIVTLAMTSALVVRETAEAPAQQAIDNPLVGTWQMTSWTRELTATGEKSDAFGPNPRGWINYSPSGRMMVLVVKSDRKAPAEIVPTDQERIALYGSMLAYSGTYTFDKEKVIHQIDTSWNQAWTGTGQTRFYKINGKTLTLRGAPAKDAIDGKESVYMVVWEKVE
jgi:hypothetical protein